MEVSQVLDNITVFLNAENGNAVPSQIVVSGGQASTQYTITPQAQYGTSKTDQLSTTQTNGQPTTNNTATTIGGAVTQSVVNGATSSLTTANQATKVFTPTFSSSFADQWSQNWTIQVINDGNALRKLVNLYRYAADKDHEFKQAVITVPLIDNPYEVSFSDYAAFYERQHHGSSFDEVYSHYKADVPDKIPDPHFKPNQIKFTPGTQMNSGPKATDEELCLKISKKSTDFAAPVSLRAYGRSDLWMSQAAYNFGCLQKFVFLIHDAEGATAQESTDTTSKLTVAARKAGNPLILRSPIPNSTALFSIPNPLQH